MGDLIARVLENDEARFFLTLLAIAGAFVWILSAISSTAQNAPRDPERPYRKRRPAIRRRGSSLSSTGSRGKGPGARALGFDECPSAQPRAFRLDDLPSELILDIMETSALRWSSSYTTLRLVSRRLNTLADRACLIHVPVLLANAHKTIAFRTFLDRRPRALPYVRHLWVAPALDAEGDLAYVAAIVLRRCTNLRSLACTARMLHEAIAHAPLFRTECCRRLTILAPPAPGVGGNAWGDLRGNATVTNFLGRVTHMRIAGEIPRLRDGEVFARLTHLSIVYEGPVGQITEDLAALTDDAKTHGTLRRVVVTVRGISRTIPYGDQWKSKGQRWMVLALPSCWNEVDMWKNQVRGRGLWDIISGRLVST